MHHEYQTDDRCPTPHSRRVILGFGATAATLALAGCLGGFDESAPAPVSIPSGADCDSCGMVIPQHPGPNGQIFFEEHEPESHSRPFRYDSLKQCLFPDLLEAQQLGRSELAVYATDYSSVDYSLETEGGTTYISSHVEATSFAPAQGLTYVIESAVDGAMGPDFIPFANRDEAEAFTGEHGGDLVAYDDIDERLIGK